MGKDREVSGRERQQMKRKEGRGKIKTNWARMQRRQVGGQVVT